MSKAFTREQDSVDDEDILPASELPVGVKNYITPSGHRRLQEEVDHLWKAVSYTHLTLPTNREV